MGISDAIFYFEDLFLILINSMTTINCIWYFWLNCSSALLEIYEGFIDKPFIKMETR